MLPKTKRLGKSLVQTVLKQGKTVVGSGLSLRVYYSKNLISSHFAVVIPSKIIKNAVGRNHLRRRTYTILRQEWPRINLGVQVIVFINQRQLAELSLSEFRGRLLALLQQSHILV